MCEKETFKKQLYKKCKHKRTMNVIYRIIYRLLIRVQRKEKHKANKYFKKRLCVVCMKLQKHTLLWVNNLKKVTSSNHLIKYSSLAVIN